MNGHGVNQTEVQILASPAVALNSLHNALCLTPHFSNGSDFSLMGP